MLVPRLVEEKMFILLRQNKISKWFSAYGQEAISAGIALAADKNDWIFPAHRNLGIFVNRLIPLDKLFAQWMGKAEGFTKGRDRSFHFGSTEHRIGAMISHMAAHLPVACGRAWAHTFANDNQITIAICGEGATSQGDFHEALNMAAVWNLPVLFIVENNGYALSTPASEQFKCYSIIDKAPGYGMDALQVDGNNILEVYDTVKQVAATMRANPRPVLIEMLTFRVRGHEEASGTHYVPDELIEKWEEKDPVRNFEDYLVQNALITVDDIAQLKEKHSQAIQSAWEAAESYPSVTPNTMLELSDVYAQVNVSHTMPNDSSLTDMRLVDAIADALRQSMLQHENLIIYGQDIGVYGGVFKVTNGLQEEYGKERVKDTPLCESALAGMALGLSIGGYKAVVEMQFSDFVSNAFNQIVNNLAKSHYRWGQAADVTIRMPTGAGTGAGPFHSQSTEAWFYHVPGLKIVYPSTPYQAKGLLCAAINDPNPVLFFEHKALYRSLQGKVPDDYYTLEIGKAYVTKQGNDVSVITYGMGVHWAEKACAETLIDAEIVDLCTLLPWDVETVASSVKKTGRVIVLNEDTLTGSISAEIAAWIGENLFEFLDAPVARVGALDTPVPFSTALEENFLPYYRLSEKLKELANW